MGSVTLLAGTEEGVVEAALFILPGSIPAGARGATPVVASGAMQRREIRHLRPLEPVAAFRSFESPWGVLHVVASERGIVAVEHDSEVEALVERVGSRLGGIVLPEQEGLPQEWIEHLDLAARQFGELFAGRRRSLDLPLDLRGLGEWDARVLRGAMEVPYGEVTTYGRLAGRVGSPRAARAVGSALGRNPLWIVVPCHRIIAGDGSIGGYGGDRGTSTARTLKMRLLEAEGVTLPVRRFAD